MENLLERARNRLRSAADRLAGRHVPVLDDMAELENLENRPLLSAPADVLESEREVMVRIDAPGAFVDNTRVHCDAKTGLTVHVKRDRRAQSDRIYGDIAQGDWYRSFSLPQYVDDSAARATVSQGVVTVHLPKRNVTKPIEVPVHAT